ncbi:MAG: hypothetical protein SNJ70_00085 [Armatimonadota bacterium]
MNSRDRVLRGINHEKLDRFPTDIWCTGEVFNKLIQNFGSADEIYSALHIDGIAMMIPEYKYSSIFT